MSTTTKLLHPRGKFEIYFDENQEFRWRVTSINGEIIAASSEGFFSENYCEHNAKLTLLATADYFKAKPKKILASIARRPAILKPSGILKR